MISKLNKKHLVYLTNIFIFFILYQYFFFWDYLNNYFFLTIGLYLFLIFFKIYNFNYNKKIFNISIFIFIIIIFQSILLRNYYNFDPHNLNYLFKLSLIPIIFFFNIFFIDIIVRQIKFLAISFSVIYFFINLGDLLINLKTITSISLINDFRCYYGTGFFRNNIIFTENSHFGMVAVALVFYLLFISSLTKNFFYKIFLIIIVISFLYNSSTTFFVGYIFSYFAIYACCYKKLNKNFFFSSFAYLLLVSYLLFSSSSCSIRITDASKIIDVYLLIDKKNKEVTQDKEVKQDDVYLLIDKKNKEVTQDKEVKQDKEDKEFFDLYEDYRNQIKIFYKLLNNYGPNNDLVKSQKNKLDEAKIKLKNIDQIKFETIEKNFSKNLTSQVYIRSFFILMEALKSNPFGFGLFNYEIAYASNIYKTPYINPAIIYLNNKDASNNFVKLLSELGIFGVVLLIVITFACLSKKVDYEVKIFLIPLIITQLIRGAGYFNGGFFIALNILITLYIISPQKAKQ